jgi:glyoxylase-like metal-dependent hydrolase (beta-lactamase superfamily II)
LPEGQTWGEGERIWNEKAGGAEITCIRSPKDVIIPRLFLRSYGRREYMPEEVLPHLFRIEIPMPNNPLKYLNSYVIKAQPRNLIIDTGLDRKECLDSMVAGLSHLGVRLENTDFFITHMHADHFALVSKLVTDTSRVYFNRPDAEVMQALHGLETLTSYASINGFPEDVLRAAIHSHPGFKYGIKRIPELSFLKDGDTIRIGEYLFKCVETPGHTRGHICLYEPTQKILIAGDHILHNITPNIQCWTNQGNPLKNYLASLDKVSKLEVDMVLPGHRLLFRNHRERIEELKTHHKNRLDEVLSILGKGSKNAFQVASEMTWDIDCASWDLFPAPQKWFATGEAISHLRYLEKEEAISRQKGAKIITYALNHD